MKIYSSKHQAIVEAPIREKPEYSEGDDAFDRQLNYQIKMQAYNKWLSTHKPVPDEFKDYWADGQEVPDSAYEVKKQWLREKANEWLDVDMHLPINYYCKTRLVAIPKKEKEDYVPNVQSNNEASVASHSSGFSNSIEQPASIEMANRILANYKPDNMYEHNEIKKLLYKQQPKAKFIRMKSNHAYYGTFVELADKTMQEVVFIIPFSDLGDAELWRDEDAKLLIRYLPKNN
jgi:hypothetical protein